MDIPPEPNLDGMSLDDKCNYLYEENKKLRIDLSSLQLSNRALVNQNRDVKKKVMDYRLQISDLEGRLKKLESVSQDLQDTQNQCENMRIALDKAETNVASIEYRASQAEEKLQLKERNLDKVTQAFKEMEERLNQITSERQNLANSASRLEKDLSEASNRVKDFDKLTQLLNDKTELLDKLLTSSSEQSQDPDSILSVPENSAALAAANAYFKSQQDALEKEIKNKDDELHGTIEDLNSHKDLLRVLETKYQELEKEHKELVDKSQGYEAKIKDLTAQQKKMKDSRIIGPVIPPWISSSDKKSDKLEQPAQASTMETLSNVEPSTLKTRILELESKVNELNNLLTYREDVILRIHEEISRKASQLEAVEVDRASLKAQVDIIKKEYGVGGKKGSVPKLEEPVIEKATKDNKKKEKKDEDSSAQITELEAECERLRGKRDREYQRRKRVEAELDEFEQEINKLREKLKTMEEAMQTEKKKSSSQSADREEKNKTAALQSTLAQLRMDNEAKRSEMFDLRSRYDDKCNAFDKVSGEMKSKDAKCTELEKKLKSTEQQLFEANKDLEFARCQVVRGGPEVQRLQADVKSLQTSNAFLTIRLEEAERISKINEPKIIASQIQMPSQKDDDFNILCKKLNELERRLDQSDQKYQTKLAEYNNLKSKLEQSDVKVKMLEEEVKEFQAAGSKKRKREEETSSDTKRSRKSRFDNEDDATNVQQYCSNCAKSRAKLVETESQLKAALEREASLRLQLKDFKSAGGSAVELQSQLMQHRRNLKLTCEAAERLLSALGPSMYDDPAVLSMREILGSISY